jgi:polysaccharide biosynthesis/export protein
MLESVPNPSSEPILGPNSSYTPEKSAPSCSRFLGGAVISTFLACLAVLLSACATSRTAPMGELAQLSRGTNATIVLREGDAVRITFPGAPNLNTTTLIRRDGMIALPLVGECRGAGLTLAELEKAVLKLYEPQLQTKEVAVTLESSLFPIYVTGAVLRPGKIAADRPLTVLEAVMEAGGFDYRRANLKSIQVLRQSNGSTKHFTVNLKGVLRGQSTEDFRLEPTDIIYVPERFTWF